MLVVPLMEVGADEVGREYLRSVRNLHPVWQDQSPGGIDMSGALVPLRETTSFPPLHFQYRLGSTLFHVNELLVCVTCETVVGSVKDNPVCPTCTLREEIEEIQQWIDAETGRVVRRMWDE